MHFCCCFLLKFCILFALLAAPCMLIYLIVSVFNQSLISSYSPFEYYSNLAAVLGVSTGHAEHENKKKEPSKSSSSAWHFLPG